MSHFEDAEDIFADPFERFGWIGAVAPLLLLVLALVQLRWKHNKQVLLTEKVKGLCLANCVEKRGPTRGIGPGEQPNLPSHTHLQGCFIPYTGETLYYPNEDNRCFEYETDMVLGKTFCVHRATWDPALNKSGDYPFGHVFKGRKINWEVRIQLRFKHAPDGSLKFGIELDEYVPLMGTTKTAMKAMVSLLKQIVGKDLHHSPGDDPAKTVGEAERPMFSMPMIAFDQFIETPEGEEPPALTDANFMQLGIRRADDMGTFTRTMNAVKFRPGPTYTFNFFSISQFMDNILWQIRVAPGLTLDYDSFCGRPPIHLVLYTLRPPPVGSEDDGRHLDSRKTYLYHLAFWSSKKQPPQHRLEQLLPNASAITQSSTAPCSTKQRQRKQSGLLGGCFEGLFKGSGGCMPMRAA